MAADHIPIAEAIEVVPELMRRVQAGKTMFPDEAQHPAVVRAVSPQLDSTEEASLRRLRSFVQQRGSAVVLETGFTADTKEVLAQ